MGKKEVKLQFNSNELEKWMENFFLDPNTSLMDQLTFRIDLYETVNEIIVEALLIGCNPDDIKVYLNETRIMIKVANRDPYSRQNEPFLTRTVDFPFSVIAKEVHVQFKHDVLEVFISKHKQGSGKNRSISLSKRTSR